MKYLKLWVALSITVSACCQWPGDSYKIDPGSPLQVDPEKNLNRKIDRLRLYQEHFSDKSRYFRLAAHSDAVFCMPECSEVRSISNHFNSEQEQGNDTVVA